MKGGGEPLVFFEVALSLCGKVFESGFLENILELFNDLSFLVDGEHSLRHEFFSGLAEHSNVSLGVIKEVLHDCALIFLPEIFFNVFIIHLKSVGLLVSYRLLNKINVTNLMRYFLRP